MLILAPSVLYSVPCQVKLPTGVCLCVFGGTHVVETMSLSTLRSQAYIFVIPSNHKLKGENDVDGSMLGFGETDLLGSDLSESAGLRCDFSWA
jgi:hypothetical protein